MNNQTRKLVQGAMIASMFGALSLFNTYTGSLFDILICYVMTIPIVWYGYQYGLKDNIIVCIVSLIVIGLVGLPFFIISAFSSCIIGLFIAEALKRKAKQSIMVVVTFLASLLKNILIYQVFAGLLQIDLYQEMQEIYSMVETIYPAIHQQITIQTFMSLFPLLMIILSALEMYIIMMLCQIVLKRLKIEFPGVFHIALLHISKNVGWILIISMFGSYFLSRYISSIWIDYIYLLSMLTLAVQGFAFLCWLCILKKKNKLMILVFIGVFIPVVNSVLYVASGILDIFSDLRRNILYNKDI